MDEDDGKVVPIKPAKPVPHMSGPAKCLSCKHEWISVSPEGTVWLDCPACGIQMGRRQGPVWCRGENYYWMCECGNDLFAVLIEGFLCPVCGKMHTNG